MKIDLHKLYSYIFGDGADIEKDIPDNLSAENRKKAKLKLEEKITQFFADLIPFHLHSTFQAALSEIPTKSAKLLMNMLYGEEDPGSFYNFPDEKAIEIHYKKLEGHYQYFKDEKEASKALEKFKIFFKVSKLIHDCIEQKNDDYDKVAAINAYKMLVVFGHDDQYPLSPITRYLEDYKYSASPRPLYDALNYPIPVNTDTYQVDLNKWRKLIQNHGPEAFQLFELAPQIEKEFGQIPDTLDKLLEITRKQFTYQNASAHPQLSEICLEHFISESEFEYCVQVEKHRKSSDNLPNAIIDGAEFKMPGYYMVKLPIDDPRAFVLGHLTNSCQSIGGESEQCVIDGITRKNNGFYVLLKAKEHGSKLKPKKQKTTDKKQDSETKTSSPLKENKINYDKFEIIGQGYAWLSLQGNLTFDSWENLKPGRDNQVIVPMLEKFSQMVTHNPDYNITRVTIGTGGKTPEKWANQTEEVFTYREFMKEGFQYEDSISQVEIYCNQEKRLPLLTSLKETLNKMIPLDEKEAINQDLYNWIINSCYSKEYVDRSQAILEKKETQTFLISLLSAEDSSEFNEVPWDIALSICEKNFELSEPIWELIRKSFYLIERTKTHADKILNSILLLDKSFISSMDPQFQYVLMETLLQNPEHALEYVNNVNCIFKKMYAAKLETDLELYQLMLTNPDEAFLNAFTKLRKIELHNDQQIRTAVFDNPDDAEKIATAFFMLKSMQIPTHKDNIKETILKNSTKAIEIAKQIIMNSAPLGSGLFGKSSEEKKPSHQLDKKDEAKISVSRGLGQATGRNKS